MARQLKVPRNQAVEIALQLFWSKGYKSTSVDDLQEAIGIQRGSFYFHFKDKHALFLEVLHHYKKTVVEARRELVRRAPSPRAGIHLYFDRLVEHLAEGRLNLGCLNTNTATELGPSDPEVADFVQKSMLSWQTFWIEILELAKERGEVPGHLDVASTADHLVALTQGLNVVSRVNRERAFLERIVAAGLATLGPAPRSSETRRSR